MARLVLRPPIHFHWIKPLLLIIPVGTTVHHWGGFLPGYAQVWKKEVMGLVKERQLVLETYPGDEPPPGLTGDLDQDDLLAQFDDPSYPGVPALIVRRWSQQYLATCYESDYFIATPAVDVERMALHVDTVRIGKESYEYPGWEHVESVEVLNGVKFHCSAMVREDAPVAEYDDGDHGDDDSNES